MGSRGGRNNQMVYEINGSSLDFSEAPRHTPQRAPPNRPAVYHTGYLEMTVEPPTRASPSNPNARAPSNRSDRAPSNPSARAPSNPNPRTSSNPSARASSNSDGSGTSGYKEPSDYSIYKSYGGYMNFLHSHGLRVWNPEDVDEGHQIVAEIKKDMRQEAAEASRANYSRN